VFLVFRLLVILNADVPLGVQDCVWVLLEQLVLEACLNAIGLTSLGDEVVHIADDPAVAQTALAGKQDGAVADMKGLHVGGITLIRCSEHVIHNLVILLLGMVVKVQAVGVGGVSHFACSIVWGVVFPTLPNLIPFLPARSVLYGCSAFFTILNAEVGKTESILARQGTLTTQYGVPCMPRGGRVNTCPPM